MTCIYQTLFAYAIWYNRGVSWHSRVKCLTVSNTISVSKHMIGSADDTKATQTKLRCSYVEVIATKMLTVVITNWLPIATYPFLEWRWIFSLLHILFSFFYQRQYLTVWVTWVVSDKKQALLTLRIWVHTRYFSICCRVFFSLSCVLFAQYCHYFLIPTSVFSNVYLLHLFVQLYFQYILIWSVRQTV